jgi:hypothetical protein
MRLTVNLSPAARLQEERVLHEAKLAKMEAEMKMVFQQKVQEKESKLKQSEEELYARHKEMKDALDKQRSDLEDKKRKIESGRPLTPEKSNVRCFYLRSACMVLTIASADLQEEPFPQGVGRLWTPENYAGLSLSLRRSYLILIIATCPVTPPF